jgi:hypothetical protein
MQTTHRGGREETMRQGVYASQILPAIRRQRHFLSSSSVLSAKHVQACSTHPPFALDTRDLNGGVQCAAREVSCDRMWRYTWPIRKYVPSPQRIGLQTLLYFYPFIAFMP